MTEWQNLLLPRVIPFILKKKESKGRSKQELHEVIEWLTGFNENNLEHFIEQKTTFEMFFQQAKIHPNAHLITGKICGYRIEDIEHPLTKQNLGIWIN